MTTALKRLKEESNDTETLVSTFMTSVPDPIQFPGTKVIIPTIFGDPLPPTTLSYAIQSWQKEFSISLADPSPSKFSIPARKAIQTFGDIVDNSLRVVVPSKETRLLISTAFHTKRLQEYEEAGYESTKVRYKQIYCVTFFFTLRLDNCEETDIIQQGVMFEDSILRVFRPRTKGILGLMEERKEAIYKGVLCKGIIQDRASIGRALEAIVKNMGLSLYQPSKRTRQPKWYYAKSNILEKEEKGFVRPLRDH